MNEPSYFYCVIPLALALGVFFLWCLARLAQNNVRQDRVAELESKYHNAGNARSTEKILLIEALRCTPRGTADYEYLSNRLKLYDRIDKEVSAKERREIVDLETVIDDRTQYELDHGINPYKTNKEPRRVLKSRRVW